ncbi:MAG: anthranilate phosphoribosyltransferase [Candidatus Omnitrophica bacterium]|nr:anthranilate phosphoribosyltransferase [Candidatus Omnitrophota bacterium]
MIKKATEKAKRKENLSENETEAVFTEIMGGKAEVDDIASFLLALKEKKETVEEITGAARIMRKFATKINPKKPHLLDTCGTGGDSANTFNISTISAFVASGAGCSVAKHGNKAVSSKCGSADLLECLGVNIAIEKDTIEKCIDEVGIGFLFAPKLHLAMKYAMPARKKIKARSIFNILGPLTNPAGAEYQLLGVYDEDLVETLANVLNNLGSERAMIVHGKDGLDEMTTTDSTTVAELKDKKVKIYTIKPEDLGLPRSKKEELKGGDTAFNVRVTLDILNKKKGFKRDIVTLNAGAAIYITGIADTLRDGIKKAKESIDSGAALEKLEKLKELTNKLKT